jgi:hypothetical protein
VAAPGAQRRKRGPYPVSAPDYLEATTRQARPEADPVAQEGATRSSAGSKQVPTSKALGVVP